MKFHFGENRKCFGMSCLENVSLRSANHGHGHEISGNRPLSNLKHLCYKNFLLAKSEKRSL